MTSHGLRVLLIAVVIGLAGCGVKGDLELPATRTTGAAP
ncbi:lipoprotein [Spiribacter sp. 2438]|nr:lipoprotein [Spiribacter sp. 2438]